MDGTIIKPSSLGLDTIYQYAGSGVQFFSGTVFYLLIVHIFSASAVGAIAIFLAIVGLFNVVFSFGLGKAVQHFTSYNIGIGDYNSVRHVIFKILAYGFILSLAGFVSLIALSGEISVSLLHSHSYTALVRLLSLVLLGNILFGILNGAILGIQNFRISAAINITIWIIYYFGSLLLTLLRHSLNTLIYGWVIGVFLGVFLEFVMIIVVTRNYGGKPKRFDDSTIFRYSLPLLFAGVITYGANYTDRFVVSGLLNLASLAVYNYALLIGSALGFLALPFNNIIMSKFSQWYGGGDRARIKKNFTVSSTFLSAIYVPAAMGVIALSGIIISVLAGSAYLGGQIPLVIILLTASVFVAVTISIQTVAAIRKTWLFLLSGGLSLISNLIISVVTVPLLGMVGAAIGFSSIDLVTFSILYYYLHKEGYAAFNFPALIKVWVAAIVMFICVTFLADITGSSHLYLPLYVVAGAVVYTFMMRVLRILSDSDKSLIISIFSKHDRLVRRLISVI